MVWQTNLHVAAIPAGQGTEGVGLCLLCKSKVQFWSFNYMKKKYRCCPVPLCYGPTEEAQPSK